MRYNIPQFQVATLFFAFGPTTIQAEFDSFKAADWQAILDDIVREIQPHLTKGKVASYIPALAEVRQDQFGVAFTTIHGETFKAGCRYPLLDSIHLQGICVGHGIEY
jgi:hypothetical protein